ncbi:MAG: GNAT family N-acetyltransferase [Bacteroidetes bacterium]|nr:GNAT family N-acetyltransferase [Rhodothermia bacterium]MCS7154314.1 GNAT family N-acetyltransferase [Bacteroidota bacterium]MCX7906650.1 GNAT family N-acetyltransferase [Bacteroidota bacterium]MDW8137070.1 GNAT family N-acetyltransferase [Bacteroidota bacterium]MDW8285059.1 GNAT family N-acetyltransferase [Bacteroidota bacterium]
MAEDSVRWVEAEEAFLLEALLARSPQRVPFIEAPFAQAAQRLFRVRLRWLGYRRGDRLLAAVPIFEARRLLLGRLTRIPPLAVYLPFVLAPMSEADYWRACRELLRFLEARYGLCHFILHPTQPDVRPFQWRGWSVEPRYTYWITLDEPERMLKSYSESVRRAWRRYADRYAFLAHDPEAWGAMVELHRASYLRRGRRPPLPEAAHRSLAQDLGADERSGPLRVASVRDVQGRVLATIGWLGSAGTAYYWMAGSRRDVPQAMTVLLGHWFRHLAEAGWTRVDFVGANTPSIAEFKRRFGGKLIGYYRVWRYRRPWWAIVDRIRSRKALG